MVLRATSQVGLTCLRVAWDWLRCWLISQTRTSLGSKTGLELLFTEVSRVYMGGPTRSQTDIMETPTAFAGWPVIGRMSMGHTICFPSEIKEINDANSKFFKGKMTAQSSGQQHFSAIGFASEYERRANEPTSVPKICQEHSPVWEAFQSGVPNYIAAGRPERHDPPVKIVGNRQHVLRKIYRHPDRAVLYPHDQAALLLILPMH